MPSRRTSWPGSPAASRSFSSFQIGLTMRATGRSGLGNPLAGAPDCAMSACAAATVNAAARTAAIVARIAAARTRAPNEPGLDGAKAAPSASAERAGQHRADQLPTLAVEALHLHLLDRVEVVDAGVDRDVG